MVRKYSWIILAILIILPLVACSSTTPAPTTTAPPKSATSAAPSPAPTTAAPKPTTAAPTTTAAPKPTGAVTTIRLATGAPETLGYAFGLALQKVANPYLAADGIQLTALSTPGSDVNMRMVAAGDAESAWTSSFSMYLAITNQGPWEKSPLKVLPQAGFFSQIATEYFVCNASVKDKVNSIRDLGKNYKIAIAPVGTSTHDMDLLILKTLGISDSGKPIDRAQVADAMARNEVQGTTVPGGMGLGGNALQSWFTQTMLKTKVKYVAPSAEETQLLKGIRGLAYLELPINKAVWPKDQDLGAEKFAGVWSSYGFHFAPTVNSEAVYKTIKVIYDHWNEVLAISNLNTGFGPSDAAKQNNVAYMDGLVGTGIKMNAGAVKFFKEVGLWKDTWQSLVP